MISTIAKIQYMEHISSSLETSTYLSNVAKSQEETSEKGESLRAKTSSMTPISTDQGRPRAEAFDASSSTREAFSNPAPSFGARFNNIPTSISTPRYSPSEAQMHRNSMNEFQQGQSQLQPEWRQKSSATQADEAAQDTQLGENFRPIIRRQGSRSPELPRLPPLRTILGDVSSRPRETNKICQSNVRPANPYAHRADEIGLRHCFPGVGVVNDFLTPPNWHPGQDPISEAEAQELYEKARVWAQQKATDFINSVEHDPNREERLETFQEQWHAQRRMDESVLLERRKIHKAFLQFKREQDELPGRLRTQPQQGILTQEVLHRPLAGALPLPVHNPLPMYHGAQQAHRTQYPWTRNINTPSPPLGIHHLYQRLHSMEGLHFPNSSPLSPSFLDPTLVPQTYEAALHYYNQNKILLNQYILENERYLSTSTARFNRQAPAGSLISPGVVSSRGLSVGARSSMQCGAVPMDHTHASPSPVACDPAAQAQLRRTPGPASGPFPRQTISGQYTENGQFGHGSSIHTQTRTSGAQLHGQSYLREVQNVESPPKASHRKGSSHDVASRDPEGDVADLGKVTAADLPSSESVNVGPQNYQLAGPEIRSGREEKREERANSAKTQVQDEIAAARLPTPKISDQALRAAGVKPKSKSASLLSETTDASSKLKGRSRKNAFPAAGMRVSGAFGSALLAARVKDTSEQAPIAAVAAPSGSTSAEAIQPYAPTATPVSKAGQNVIDLTQGVDSAVSNMKRRPDRTSSKAIADDGQPPRLQQYASKKTSTSSLSSIGDGSHGTNSSDDLNIRGYGKRANEGGRNATKTRKASVSPGKPLKVPTKRRLSFNAPKEADGKHSRQKL